MRFDLSFYLIDHRLLALAMVAVLVVIVEIGYRAGTRWMDAPDSLRSQVSGIGAAMLGILGVLLGFTLSMAIARWDVRRDVVVEESNAIGTLWLRAGLLELLENGDDLCDRLQPNVTKRDFGGVPVLDIKARGWEDNGKVLVYTHGGAYTFQQAPVRLFGLLRIRRFLQPYQQPLLGLAVGEVQQCRGFVLCEIGDAVLHRDTGRNESNQFDVNYHLPRCSLRNASTFPSAIFDSGVSGMKA